MKRKFDRLRETLDEFLQQDDYPMLVVVSRSEELAYVLNFLQALEQTLPSHLVIVFHQVFANPTQWLDAVLAGLRPQLAELASDRAQRSEPPPPPLPFDIEDSRCPAPQRLHALLRYLLSLLPDQQDHRLAVGLLPLECSDSAGFAELVATVVPHPEIPDWMMPALRLIVWDERERPVLRDGLLAWGAKHVLTYSDDFSTPALTDALSQDAGNRDLPLAERMVSFQQLAALDYAYKRYDDALAKYALLHEYHHQQAQPDLQALALLGAGDTLFAAGDPVMAKHRLQQGIALAMDCQSLPVLLNLLTSATDVSTALGQHADAESYADSGAQVAAAALSPFVYCDLLAKRGDAQVAQSKLSDGLQSYTRCRELCRSYGHFDRWLAVIDKQASLYERAGMDRERRHLGDERVEVELLQRQPPLVPGGPT